MQFIWIIFAVMFFALAGFHLWLSRLKIELLRNHGKIASTNGLQHGTKENMEEVNKYINTTNTWNSRIKLAQSAGYFLAGLTAVFSYFLS